MTTSTSHLLPSSVPQYETVKNEEALFELFKDKNTGTLNMNTFLSSLVKTTGLRTSDPRLREMMQNLEHIQTKHGTKVDIENLNLLEFESIIAPDIGILSQAFRQQFVIPDFEGFVKVIEKMYWKCKNNTNGKVATYIPQLARVNPNYWGVSVCTIDGQRYSIGDVNIPFTIQSTSKPITYAIALNTLGSEAVHNYVGQEPSGRIFNELILDYDKKPHNPMVNAGAIIICAILQTLIKPEMNQTEKLNLVINYLERLSGGETIGFNNSVFLSERETADRNYALGFYMREHKCFPEGTNFKDCMDFYFQCCSIETNCDSASVIASTLANGGVCPLTEEKVLNPGTVRDVLSLMHSCGMYDYSGQFAFKVGLPAKSGVSGALLLVVPNVMGMCLFSPSLEPTGNSCRGLEFCEELVKKFNFHRYDNLRHATAKYDPRRKKFETQGLNIVNLLYAAAYGDTITLRRHKLSGMDMSLADYDSRTALHVAAAEGHYECVEFLLTQCHVPWDVRDRWGRSPMDEAMEFGHNRVVELLQRWEEEELKNQEEEEERDPPLPCIGY